VSIYRLPFVRSAGRVVATVKFPQAVSRACHAMTAHVRAIDPPDLVLEIISIVVAILLAFGLNFLAGQIKTRYDERVALTAISTEIASNEALVAHLHARHLTKCSTLQTLARRGRAHKISYTEFQNTLDAVLPFVMPPVQATAWSLANASGESANFDYAARADLARVYSQQQAFSRFGDDLSADFRPVDFTRDADFFLVARNAARDCTNDTMFEDRLEATYLNEIKKLPQHA
jgi:hypothetical protein